MQGIADHFESILNNKVEDMRRTSDMKEFSTTDQIISQHKLRFQDILHRIIVCSIVKCDWKHFFINTPFFHFIKNLHS